MTLRNLLLLTILTLTLVACGQSTAEVQMPASTPTPPQPPEPGMATVIGRLINPEGEFMPRTIVRLAEVARGVEGRGGAFILDVAHSPSTFTDEFGYFIMPNIKASEYVIVIGDVELTGIYEIIHEADGKARVYNMPADQITDVGNITTTIQPPQLLPGLSLTPAPITEPQAYPSSYPTPTRPSYPEP